MKYIRYFEDNTNLENFKDDIEKVFENKEWLIIKPKSFEAFCYYGQDQGWTDVDYNRKYNFRADTYININKDDDKKIVLNFGRGEFYGKDEDTIYLKEFFDENPLLYNFYGDIIYCSDIVKENVDYWIIVGDYDYFSSYFKLDRDTSEKFIKSVLLSDAFQYFDYDNVFDIDEYGLDVDDENFSILKMILILEKLHNEDEYDYFISDIKNYNDVVHIINTYDFDEIESMLKNSIRRGHQDADADAAYEDLTDDVYDFFELELGSAKWQQYKNKKEDLLWIKFKTKEAAFRAKFLINNYDDSYDDDKIDYSQPYNGYNGKTETMNEVFNNEFLNSVGEYDNNGINWKMIEESLELWKEIKLQNPDIDEDELYDDFEIRLNAKKYNIN